MRGAARITMIAGGLLVAAAWAAGVIGLPVDHWEIVNLLPEAVAVFLVILSWRYRRHRLAAAAILVAAADSLVRSGPFALPQSAGASVLAISLGGNLIALGVTRDRPFVGPAGLLWPLIVAAQCWVAVYGVHLGSASLRTWLVHSAVQPIALIGAVVVAALVFVFRRGAFEGSLVWVAVAGAAALLGWRDAPSATLFFAAAQLALITGFFEDSYRLAFHDELTGLPGRRSLNESMRNLGGSFAIAMVDVDNFKRFNDRYGHDAGDQALRMIADELAKTGGGGRAYRYGGEEFAIIFHGKTVADLRQDLEDFRRSVADRKFALRGPDRPRTKPDRPSKAGKPPNRVTVTVSIGVANTNQRRSTPNAVLRAADRALYRAKHAGRNRVLAAGDRLPKK